jgi:uncharacterized membrane protein
MKTNKLPLILVFAGLIIVGLGVAIFCSYTSNNNIKEECDIVDKCYKATSWGTLEIDCNSNNVDIRRLEKENCHLVFLDERQELFIYNIYIIICIGMIISLLGMVLSFFRYEGGFLIWD